MSFSLVAHSKAGTGTSGGSTSGIDTTGSSLLVVLLSYYSSAISFTLSDNYSNSWNFLTAKTTAGNNIVVLAYATNPTVGAGHTITIGGSFVFGSICFAAFSGAKTTVPFDAENGAVVAGGTSLQPGSVTPSENNELIICGSGFDQSIEGSIAINSSFSFADIQAYSAGNYFGAGLGYLIQGSASAVNPTLSWSGTANVGAVAACFKAAAGGGGFFSRVYYDMIAGGQG